MYPGGVVVLCILVGVVVWIGFLTYLVFKNKSYLERLFPSKNGSFKDKLVEILERAEDLEKLRLESLRDLSRVALLRYNPYNDTGGDQSFSLALLNREGDGVVITSLHSRSSTRVFAKGVKKGLEEATSFSEEEQKVVKQALEK